MVFAAHLAVSACLGIPPVGAQLEVVDMRSFGPWWHPTSHLRRLVSRRPWSMSEAGFAWHRIHSPNIIAFAERSVHGNGCVAVIKAGPWRCLTFDDVEQGIAYCREGRGAPEILGFEYLRVMAAAALAFGTLQPVCSTRSLCIGLGAGALPGFLAHRFPALDVTVVELDPLVLRVARDMLCCEFNELSSTTMASLSQAERMPYCVLVGDAAEHVARLAEEVQAPMDAVPDERRAKAAPDASRGGDAADVNARLATLRAASGFAHIFLDAFDREGETPAHLLQPPFLRHCRRALAPGGVLVVNCFNGVEGSPAREEVERLAQRLADAIGPVSSLQVATQEQSVVLVARCGTAEPRPGRIDLRRAAYAAWRLAACSRCSAGIRRSAAPATPRPRSSRTRRRTRRARWRWRRGWC